MDFCLWDEIEGRVLEKDCGRRETAKSYQARLRRTAMRLPRSMIRKCLQSMRKRIVATVDAKGGHIKMD